MVLSWFRKAISPSRRPQAAKSQRPRYHKVYLELLEDRTLLSSGFVFTVNLGGDAGVSDGVMTTKNGVQADYGGDFRYVLSETNTQFYAGSTILFDTSATGINSNIIKLNSGDGNGNGTNQGELKISQSTTITGPGELSLTISGNNQSRVFNITSQSAIVSISGLTITKGDARPAPNNSGNQGGDIFNSGTLTLMGDIVSAGVAAGNGVDPIGEGGGIFNAGGGTKNSGGTLIVDSTTVSGNFARGSASNAGVEGRRHFQLDVNATVVLAEWQR